MEIKELNKKIAEALCEDYDLVGIDGNAFSVIAYVTKAMKEQGFSKEEIDKYKEEVANGDYNELLAISVAKVDECNERLKENKIKDAVSKATEQDTDIGPQPNGFTVTFKPGTYFIGDICYCLNDDEYDNIWGKKYEYKDGSYGFFAVGGTAYGDGEYYGGEWAFPVDAGVIGVVDMAHSKRSAEELDGDNYGCVLTINHYLTFTYNNCGIFNFEYDGQSFTIDTRADEEDDEYEDDYENEDE